MIKGIGIDIVEIDRIRDAIEKFSDRFLKRVYTPFELNYCQNRGVLKIPELAVRFAAKEAYVKALGTGFRGIFFQDIEVRNDAQGKPEIFTEKTDPQKVHLTLSHSRDYAVAQVVIEK